MNHLNEIAMDACTLLARNTASMVQSKNLDYEMIVSAVINKNLIFHFSKKSNYIPISATEMIGTTVQVNKPISTSKTNHDEFELDYIDDHEVVAKAPINKSFRIKAKIKSVSRFQPKVFND